MAGDIQTNAGKSFAADVAGYYTNKIRFLKKDSDLSFGFNISNIGNKISYTNVGERDFIPINLKLGSSININFDDYNSMSYSFDINKLLVPTPPLYNSENEIIAGKDPNVSVVSGIFQSFSDAPDGFQKSFVKLIYLLEQNTGMLNSSLSEEDIFTNMIQKEVENFSLLVQVSNITFLLWISHI